MLVKEIIQRIQSLYSKGVHSDDTVLSDRHIYNKMLTVRSKLISQEAKKKQKINQWNFQVLPCVELIVAPQHECPCLPPLGCEILRSRYKLPKPLTDLNSHLIKSVMTLDGSIVFSEISYKDKTYKKGNKYTSVKPDYYIRNGYLYITVKSGLRVVQVEGLFEDPLAAEKFESYCKEKCDGCEDTTDCTSMLEMDFPLDGDMVDTLIDIAKIELIEQFIQMTGDLTNNSSDHIPENSK
jgi:hypothetical protein